MFYKLIPVRTSTYFILLALCLLVLTYFKNLQEFSTLTTSPTDDEDKCATELHNSVLDNFYGKRKSWNTSHLGSILFKNENYPGNEQAHNKIFTILIWKRWEHLQKRHLFYFGSTKHDPLAECSVKNCVFSGDDNDLTTADAVVIHLHTAEIPATENRKPFQKWIYMDDEAPSHSFDLAKKKPKLSELADIFNWSMTYRIDADVPVPYGRTVSLNAPVLSSNEMITDLIPKWHIKRRDILTAILISHCNVPYRKKLLKDLQKHLKVNVHGKCGDASLKTSCPGHYKADCDLMGQYLFYIVLENIKCKEYMTEKLFFNAYSKGAIPVIQGPSIEDCEKLLPPNSYLHFDKYATVTDLAKDILEISENEDRLLSYHAWRKRFEVRNEHGYFGSKSYHLCRLCEAMNYNDKNTSIYTEKDLKRFLDHGALCRS